jgi:hypothetical protein
MECLNDVLAAATEGSFSTTINLGTPMPANFYEIASIELLC